MMVTTQAELDAAIVAGDTDIIINSPAGVWLELYDSATVTAYDSATVRAYGSATVTAYGSATVTAASYVAVHLHSARAKVAGGVVIDIASINLTEPATWCEYHGVAVADGVVTLYKALGDDLTSGHQYGTVITWTPGQTLTAPDWDNAARCGQGLHLGPTAHHATAYRPDATRWVAVQSPLDGLVPILDSTAKCKVRSCTVVGFVDCDGNEVAA